MSVRRDDLQIIEFPLQITADFLPSIILVVYHPTLIKQWEADRNLAEQAILIPDFNYDELNYLCEAVRFQAILLNIALCAWKSGEEICR